MMGIFQYNRLYNDYCWMGVQDFPSLNVDVFGEDTIYITETLSFELCMDDWWPSFTADDGI